MLDSSRADRRMVVSSALMLALAVSPHTLHIERLVILTFVAMVIWKLLAQWKPWIPTNRWLIIMCAIIGFSISAWYYGPPLGRDPGVSFLITLLGLKILESRTRRDYRIVLVLGYFVVTTHFLYINQLPVVIFLFIQVFALTCLMMQLDHVNSSRQIRNDFKLTSKMILQAIPLALILFFLFPRFAGSLWLLQSASNRAITGMSDTLTMGAIAELIESKDVAFTATFLDRSVPPSGARYWRGGVLWETDGREWIRGSAKGPFDFDVVSLGKPYQYEIEMRPTRKNWLFALDIPIEQPRGAVLSQDLYLYKNNITETPTTYNITSSDQYINKTINENQRQRGIKLAPNMLTSRLARFVAEQIVQSTEYQQFDATRYAIGILEYFNKNPFVYTLRPPLLLSETPIDEFLFSTRKGFCEHYATSFVTLMRAAAVPARVIIGYLGGEHNPLTGQITVRQSDAHAWAEFWSADRGWVRVDPTAAIAPERIENPINYDLSIDADGNVKYLSYDLGTFGSLFREAGWFRGLVKQQWQRWFVGFDSKRQRILLTNLGLQQFDPRSLAVFAFLFGLFILICSAFLFYKYDRNKVDRVTKLYTQYCEKLARQGIKRKQTEGPVDFCTRCVNELPELQNQLYRITQLYTSIRYGPSAEFQESDLQMRQLKSDIKNLNLERPH